MREKRKEFAANAEWIWDCRSAFDTNKFVGFRRSFTYSGGKAILKITADSVYALYLNGKFLGSGPARAYPFDWRYDEYDLTHMIHNGKNSLSVLVNHFGVSTFHYLLAPGGLLAELNVDGERSVTPDGWRARTCAEYAVNTPRISCQQQYEEQYDAGLYDGWRERDYDDGNWADAVALRPARDGVHDGFLPRPVPYLTDEPILPFRLAEQTYANLNGYISFDIGRLLKKEPFGDTPYLIDCAFALVVKSERAQTLPVLWREFFDNLAVNGIRAQNELVLRRGENLLTFYERGVRHSTQATLCFRGNISVSAIYKIGPFDPRNDDGTFEKCDIGHYNVVRGTGTSELRNRILARLTANNITSCKDAEDFSLALHAKNSFAATYRCSGDGINAGAKLEEITGPGYCELSAHGKDFCILLDFKKEFVGNIAFRVKAPAGTEVYLHFFEFVQPDGRKNFAEGMSNALRFVCSGRNDEFRSVIRRGGRYVYFVFSGAEKVRLGSVRLYEATYPQARIGDFFCSDYLLNAIYEGSADTLRCCMEDTYTDCPTYEQTCWVGDMRNEAPVDWVINGDKRLWKRCLLLAGQSLQYNDVVLSQVPSGWWNVLPAWTMLWALSFGEYYLYTGDEAGTREVLPYLRKNFEGIKKNLTPEGFVKIDGWNMFDWAPMDTPADGIVGHVNFLTAFALQAGAKTLRVLGEDAFADECELVSANIVRAANARLWSDGDGAFADCLYANEKSRTISRQTQVAALLADAVTGERKRLCLQKALNPKDIVSSGSAFFTFFLLEVLAKECALAEKERDEKSASFYAERLIGEIRRNWGMMIDSGCNTFWEQWGEPVDGRMTRSHCHGWSTAPAYFFAEFVLGVRPLSAGYQQFCIDPHPDGLRFARGKVPTPYGVIEIGLGEGGDKILCRHPKGTHPVFDGTLNVTTEEYTRGV